MIVPDDVINAEQSIQCKINLIERYLKEHLYKSSHTMDTQIAYAVNQINAHEGKISIMPIQNASVFATKLGICATHSALNGSSIITIVPLCI